MKIVQINTVYGTGSTGKITAALYSLARTEGFEAYVAYGRGKAPSDIHTFKIGNPIDFLAHVLVNFFQGKSGFGSKSVTRRFLRWLDEIQPDMLHLHNLHGFYIHIGMLFDYIKSHDIPVIWTLHDCWPLTGQCAHFDYAACNKWETACFNCPIYRTNYPYSLFKDNSRNNYLLKKQTFTNVTDMTIVTPSKWLEGIVTRSYLQNYPTKVICNGIDLDLFQPAAHTSAESRKIILGVANVWTPQKGYTHFLKLSDMLNPTDYHIVLIGVSRKQQRKISQKYTGKITALARTSSQEELVQWYSSAYVYVNPTLEDNFPTTNLEALACGTPVITYDTGGSAESINETCGIVVEKGNVEQLKNAILSLENNAKITSAACRQQALQFDKEKRFREYLSLYSSV